MWAREVMSDFYSEIAIISNVIWFLCENPHLFVVASSLICIYM